MSKLDLDQERERIGRALEGGYMTATEHRRIMRAIDREEAKRDRAAAADARLLAEAEARRAERSRLRSALHASLQERA